MENNLKIRDLSNLSEYDLKGAVGISILTGCVFKKEFHGVINGNQIDSEDRYIVNYLSNGVQDGDVIGMTSTKISLTVPQFTGIFGSLEKFYSEYMFKPVLLIQVPDPKKDGKYILQGVYPHPNYPVKK